jgi:hypothetical protein
LQCVGPSGVGLAPGAGVFVCHAGIVREILGYANSDCYVVVLEESICGRNFENFSGGVRRGMQSCIQK